MFARGFERVGNLSSRWKRSYVNFSCICDFEVKESKKRQAVFMEESDGCCAARGGGAKAEQSSCWRVYLRQDCGGHTLT